MYFNVLRRCGVFLTLRLAAKAIPLPHTPRRRACLGCRGRSSSSDSASQRGSRAPYATSGEDRGRGMAWAVHASQENTRRRSPEPQETNRQAPSYRTSFDSTSR